MLTGALTLCVALLLSAGCSKVAYEPFDKSKIVEASFGRNHNVMILDDGSAWTVGVNSHFQLGVADTDQRLENSTISEGFDQVKQKITYQPLRIMEDVKEVVAGGYWSLFLKKDGTLWAAGDRNSLWASPGFKSDEVNKYPESMLPTQILDNVTHIAAGENHILLVKTDGSLWGMGGNVHGELGISQNTVKSLAPLAETTQIMPSGVSEVFAGPLNSFILMQDGRLLSCGTGALGYKLSTVEGGVDKKSVNFPPKEVMMKDIVKVSSGLSQTLFLDKDGVLYKSNVFANIEPALILENVKDMTSSDENFLVLMKDGSMLNNSLANAGTAIKRVFMGNKQLLTIAETGEVSLSGDNTYGQLMKK